MMRTHRRDLRYPDTRAACGLRLQRSPKLQLTDDWDEVECRNCLAARPYLNAALRACAEAK